MRHDIKQLTEIIKNQDFHFKPTSFIEIGSRDGHDTNYLSHYWNIDRYNCYIIEAHPECFKYIVDTYPVFNTLNVAASNKTEPIIFNAGIIGKEPNIGISSILNRTLSEINAEKVEIDGWRMDELMSYFDIVKFDLMKIDVEGFGLQVLEGFGDKIKLTKYIQIELETKQVWEDQSYYSDVVKYLEEKGFEILNEVDLDGIQMDVLFKNKNI